MSRHLFRSWSVAAGFAALVFQPWTALPAAEPDARSPAPAKTAQVLQFKRVTVEADKFGEGWRQSVPLTALDGDVYEISVRDGWLHAKRTSDGELDWHIVLARVVAGELPTISTIDGLATFEISYLGGRYFIRDTLFSLRALRERKTDSGLLLRAEIFSDKATARGWGNSSSISLDGLPKQVLTLSGWQLDDWFFVASGLDDTRFDAVVRLDHMSPGKGGSGVQITGGGFGRMFHGDAAVIDDGELLVASPRTLLAAYRAEEALQQVRARIRGGVAPPIDATSWLNTEGALSWDKLKGKVVVLDFWGTWCAPCVKKLPEVEAFAKKYAGSDLVVIGVHSEQDGETCADFVAKHEIKFPIAVDSGKTAESFAVASWPTVFLIDKTGKVVMGYTSKLPPDAVIDSMLKD